MNPGCAFLVVLLLFLAGCKSQSEPDPNVNGSSEPVVSSTPPFKTKEPDRYRATRITSTQTSNGEAQITKTLIARDGGLRRQESGTGAHQTIYLDLPEGRFVLLVAEKVYADITTTPDALPQQDDVTAEWMVSLDAGPTTYQKLGIEAVGGRNAQKYRIIVNTPTSSSVIVNETLLWIDEEWQMPIRSELKGSDGVGITTELTDVALEVDNRVFQIPEDYQKVTFSELINRLRKY